MNLSETAPEWATRASAVEPPLAHNNPVFESLFERSVDAIWLFEQCDPRTLLLVDCNLAALELVGAANKQQVLGAKPEDLSPPLQPGGTPTVQRVAEAIAIVQK